ncbi:MAG: DUF4129 domain-containing protein [Roseiflexaceae bacterium]|nr:DUF4129 domain-containing protein [Roseiflexaceae bacterium]
MNPTIRRVLTLFGLGLLELTPPALLLTLWGAPGAWAALAFAVFGACAADALIQRFAPLPWQRPAIALAALPLALSVVAAIAIGGDVVTALFDLDSPQSLLCYAGLLAGLYAVWRGTRLLLYEQIGLREIFARVMGTSLLVLLLAHADNSALLATATSEILLGFAIGLGTVALARAAEPGETALRAAGWRGAMPTIAAIGIVLLAGLALVALLNNEARGIVEGIVNVLVFLLAALILPIAFIFLPIIEWLLRAIHAPDLMKALQDFTRGLEQRQLQDSPFTQLAQSWPWAGPLFEWIGRLMPVLTLLILIWLVARRRAATAASTDEERVSLFSWNGLIADLADLLARLRQQAPEGGLLAALARLRADDPDSRIRRSYIRMLLIAESLQQPRAEPQTPHEYLPTAQATIPTVPQALNALTVAYEQARYSPGSASAEDATAAEQAWNEIERGASQRADLGNTG